ncbi:hypothetical protein A2331_04850 [Candidatus Falkowbacteria bacterium RIFOXYB2_FULL_34_18]|uniref:Uncharacterized protein n=1 Tax=Candidatus Falkowbacteria bacterium RIFOXYD2_FULL_34_120 TaxID=1798007 RepID=A0A1F5TNE4_9BACT|nr:MAG: hypothetical protein A2331_04850 [Candidatus Falkowbacteria bacterium RIFOXYB2_FULL_34_18]OGF28851.1 MAG: hypothetical protein A2500_00525 [Candidatus Falkowbacteria bacterium RIFOXYC12_FULL_34_55]OGF35776.1 MAG: hypothetical protein A2466_04545 [Candidatus Falkowbacteria bacterium RIFOXYC2_FULL_34_220]OGF38442.1 MAG: hypothetical protein A2515_01985 [Candidatus Falkowbacteria bacterium RIFOXYD12_FULL_34_57]OGF40502.1 MAG: hypothetical protein A2531_02940 [Candidatus Falkowbacteria bact
MKKKKKKKEILKVKLGHKRKMSKEELEQYLREKKRGCGIHGVKSNKTKRRQDKQKLKKESCV